MNERNRMSTPDEKQLDTLIVSALERKPTVRLPSDFATRVVAGLPRAPMVVQSQPRISVARTISLVAMVLITVALFLLAPHVQMDRFSLGFGVEMLLLVQLGALGYGLMRLRENGL